MENVDSYGKMPEDHIRDLKRKIQNMGLLPLKSEEVRLNKSYKEQLKEFCRRAQENDPAVLRDFLNNIDDYITDSQRRADQIKSYKPEESLTDENKGVYGSLQERFGELVEKVTTPVSTEDKVNLEKAIELVACGTILDLYSQEDE